MITPLVPITIPVRGEMVKFVHRRAFLDLVAAEARYDWLSCVAWAEQYGMQPWPDIAL